MKKLKVLLSLLTAAATILSTTLITSAEAVDYHAYLRFQTTPYSFRNQFSDADYGKETPYFNSVIVWGGNDPETYPEYEDNFDYDIEGYVMPATLTDATITGNGTYTVGVSDFDWALDGSTGFNLMIVDTDIPLDSGASITGAKIIVDGAEIETRDAFANPDDKNYVSFMAANIWNTDIDTYKGVYPTSSLAIEFTVEGLPEAEAADDAAATDEAAAADADVATDDAVAADDTATDTAAAADDKTTNEKTNSETGVEGVAVVAGLAVLAAGAVIVAKKRK